MPFFLFRLGPDSVSSCDSQRPRRVRRPSQGCPRGRGLLTLRRPRLLTRPSCPPCSDYSGAIDSLSGDKREGRIEIFLEPTLGAPEETEYTHLRLDFCRIIEQFNKVLVANMALALAHRGLIFGLS